MTNTPPKQGVRARERNALERISGLEQDFQRLVGGIQSAFNDNEAKVRDLAEVVDALVTVFPGGSDALKLKMAELRAQRATEEAQKAKEGLDMALVEGKVEQVEKIESNSIITGVEKNKDGEVIQPGYVQLSVTTVKPQFAEKMMGQAVGFSFETDGGGSFEVTGIYKAVPQVEVVEAPAPAAAAEEVVAAAEEVVAAVDETPAS